MQPPYARLQHKLFLVTLLHLCNLLAAVIGVWMLDRFWSVLAMGGILLILAGFVGWLMSFITGPLTIAACVLLLVRSIQTPRDGIHNTGNDVRTGLTLAANLILLILTLLFWITMLL